MTASGTMSDKEWQWVAQQMTMTGMSDNEWERVTTNEKDWQQMTMSDSEWQHVVKRIKTAQYTSMNGWLPSLLWQKQIHYSRDGWLQLEWLNKYTALKVFQESSWS